MSAPGQNFVFASVSGDIAMRVQAKYPARRKDEGKFVLDGSKSSNGWPAFIPNEQNVMDKNPDRGFVSSANQYPVDDTYPYYVTSTSFETYRNRRINKVLSELSAITVDDMMKLQNDNFNLKACGKFAIYVRTAGQCDAESGGKEGMGYFKILGLLQFQGIGRRFLL